MTHAFVIGRRRKGRPIGNVVHTTGQRLEAVGWTVETALVDRKRELRKQTAAAVQSDADIVVAVGGDGAVLQVIQSLADTEVALGIVPMGTGNLLAGNLRIPPKPDKAVDVIIDVGRHRIDLGRVTVGGKRRVFAVACGIGFDAEVMKATTKQGKLRWGKLAYVASAFKRRDRVRNVTHVITIDGVESTMEATQVFVANFGGMGMAIEPRLRVRPDDGVFDIIVVQASGPLPGLLAGWEALRQRRRGKSRRGNAFRAKAREIRVETEPSRLVETDGTVIGATPIDVSIRPSALTVIVPT
jgi:YegS/Rv2252/BmrU family lipid kinase